MKNGLDHAALKAKQRAIREPKGLGFRLDESSVAGHTQGIRKGSSGSSEPENLNALTDTADMVVALDRLQAMSGLSSWRCGSSANASSAPGIMSVRSPGMAKDE